MEGNSPGMPKQLKKVASSHKHLSFVVVFARWDAESGGKLLKLRLHFDIIPFRLYRSAVYEV